MTELIYCLTSSYYKRIDPIPNTDKNNLLMGLGIGLERVFVAEGARAQAGTKDGIDYSPDFWFGPIPSELKTTRMSMKKSITRDFPETWIQQIRGYCYCIGENTYGLASVHLLGDYKPPFPDIYSVKFTFDDAELKENWDYLLYRKDAYIESFARQVPPIAKRWCQSWECKNCQYIGRCE